MPYIKIIFNQSPYLQVLPTSSLSGWWGVFTGGSGMVEWRCTTTEFGDPFVPTDLTQMMLKWFVVCWDLRLGKACSVAVWTIYAEKKYLNLTVFLQICLPF